ncbi:MAG: DUF255 domain-containing protein [Caldilineaceae bacterium]
MGGGLRCKPIFLSIGYSACHWCHVMERESFENEETAARMNELFINIKVDREERPDLDAIYMDAVQAMTGQGGWPMSVFLTPDGRPFLRGHYYPPEPRYGMPSFTQVLNSVANAYQRDREKVVGQAQRLTEMLAAPAPSTRARHRHGRARRCGGALGQHFDSEDGGFGTQPKFPQPMTLDFAMSQFARTGDEQTLYMAELTLFKMANGGIYDQLGGGFHRYKRGCALAGAPLLKRCSTTTRNCCAATSTPGALPSGRSTAGSWKRPSPTSCAR